MKIEKLNTLVWPKDEICIDFCLIESKNKINELIDAFNSLDKKEAEDPEDSILDCPFCQSENVLTFTEDFGFLRIICGSCGARGPRAVNEKQAKYAWNKRV